MHPVSFLKTFSMSAACILTVFFILSGCGSETEYKTVNFGETVKQSDEPDTRQGDRVLNVAVGAMISPGQTLVNYQELVDYIGEKTNTDARLIQRKTYGEVNDLLGTGEVDIAFICTGPFVLGKEEMSFEALATPVVRSEPYYRAYLIVHKDSDFSELEDLTGGIFAFTDPESNTGAMVPSFWLAQKNETPDSFFKRVHFTYSHDNSILAVASSLVDGASVDGHIWEYYNERDPVHTSQTRVIKKSRLFGSPPLVASAFIDKQLKEEISRAVINMHEDETGKAILEHLAIDRFEAFREEWYEGVAEIKKEIKNAQNRQ